MTDGTGTTEGAHSARTPDGLAIIEEEIRDELDGLPKRERANRAALDRQLRTRFPSILATVERDLAEWRKANAAVRQPSSRGRNVLVTTLIVLSLVSAALSITSLLRQFFDVSWIPGPTAGAAAHWVMAILFLFAACFLFITGSVLLASSPSQSKQDLALEELDRASAVLRQAARTEIRASLSQLINTSRTDELNRVVHLSTENAPRLVELNTNDSIASVAAGRLTEFIEAHETSAIGISGPRGVGKTTVMRHACSHDPSRYVGVYVSAPVSYSASEFVRRLHGDVARAVLAAHGAPAVEQPTRRSSVAAARLVGAMALLGVGVAVILLGREAPAVDLMPSDALGIGLIALGLVAYGLSVLTAVDRRSRRRSRPDDPVALCYLELERLGWSRKSQATSKNAFSLRGWSTEDQDLVELSERDKSHPERVADFRSFMARYHEVSGRSLVIAVDELDKLPTADEALAIVNGLKDLFHGPGAHFLVSVSEDALANFALRGVPLRDAFDSSFDIIMPVPRFSVADSEALIGRRVLNFPAYLTLFCHALSGGLPRDLIRAARDCVDVRRRAGVDCHVNVVIAAVIRARTIAVLDGLIARGASNQKDLLLACLSAHRALTASDQLDTLTNSLNELVTSLSALTGRLKDADMMAATAWPLFRAFLVLFQYFMSSSSTESWFDELESGRPRGFADAMAEVVMSVALLPEEALARLEDIQVRFADSRGLQTSPDKTQ